jgi:hypothetical protein
MLMPISIFASDGESGRNVWNDALRNVDFDWVRDSESSALAERLAAILLAGPLAVELFGPRIRRGAASRERLQDAKTLLAAVSNGSGDRREIYTRLRAETARFLAQRRVKQAIAGLASVLFDRGTLPGDEAASVIRTHLGKPRG